MSGSFSRLPRSDLPVFRELYRSEINALILQRLHVIVLLFLLLVGTSVLLELLYHPDRALLAAVFYTLEVLACGVVLALCRWTKLRQRPTAISVALGSVLALLLTTYSVIAGVPIERIATGHVCLLSGLLVLMPWGWRAQLAVAVVAVLTIVGTLPLAPPGDSWGYALLAVATGAMTSVSGVYFLERYRYEAFVRTGMLTRESALKAGILEASLDAFVAIDRNGTVVEFNHAAEKLFGIQAGQAVGQSLVELIIPADLREQHLLGFNRYLATGRGRVTGQRFETRGMRADGSEFPIEIAITSVVQDGEQLFTGYLRDLTEQKRAQEEQSAAYRLLDTIRHVQRLFIEDSPGTKLFEELVTQMVASTQSEYGFLAEVIDPHGRWSPRPLAVAQLAWTDATHQSYSRCPVPDLASLDLRAVCAPVVTSGRPVVGVRPGVHLATADGTQIDSFLGMPVYHASEELVGVVGLANRSGGYNDRVIEYLRPLLATGAAIIKAHRSNVERRQAEVALAASKERIEEEAEIAATLLHVAQMLNEYLGQPDMLERVNRLSVDVLQCDISNTFVWDERAEVFHFKANVGMSPDVLARVRSMTFGRDSLPILGIMEHGKLIEISQDLEQSLVPAELFTLWEIGAALIAPISRKGQIVGVLINAYRQPRRFSARQRRLAAGIAHTTALALENSRLIVDLQQANRLKTEFVSTMSHELRTPLNVILGFATMARDAKIEFAERDHCLARIETSGHDLLGLIEDTLEIAKIEEGLDRVERESIVLPELWALLGEMCARMPRNHGVELQWHPASEGTVHTDPRKLTVMVRNLVGNACKFTERGWVRAEAVIDGDQLVLRVSDTGIGIRPEDQRIIFEMFRQADGSDSRRFGGTGLGLYIVRTYVQQLGGVITLDSAPGAGAAFVITLPRVPTVTHRTDQSERAA
jgi:PAS domain S-box-containing protein